jgi:hypothetical protein
VILGFVSGALVSSALNIADRVRPQVVMLVGCVGAGVANLGLIWAGGIELGVPLRFVTGLFIAGVYLVPKGSGVGSGCPGCRNHFWQCQPSPRQRPWGD